MRIRVLMVSSFTEMEAKECVRLDNIVNRKIKTIIEVTKI